MDEMSSLLQAVAADPGDDTPRLALADWLDEHDQHSRAEFIRLQIELARTDPGDDGYAEKTARMRRCGVLTKKGKHRFFDHLPTKKCKIAFRRGFIDAIDTTGADRIDTSGFDLVPLQAIRTGAKHIAKFKNFPRLKWLEYFNGYGSQNVPAAAKLLELFGPAGGFKELETLSLPCLNAACLEAGVIPKFDLPALRNFYLETGEFSYLGVPLSAEDDQDDDDYGRGHPWGGLPAHLPKNALPNPKTPLERFVWHGDDDSDLYGDDGWDWRGPQMESLLAHLKNRKLKQVEVATDYDDHESGGEGVRAAPYRQNPLDLAPTLEHVTLSGTDLRLLTGSKRKLKGLRVYEASGGNLFELLRHPVCSELESLFVDDRHGWEPAPAPGPNVTLSKLTSLRQPTSLAGFANFRFPNLISLACHGFDELLARKWPKLQTLHLSFNKLAELKAFAESDCCPNLTTLNIGEYYEDYYKSSEIDFSFLANCPHMSHLSLVRVAGYPQSGTYIVADGALVPVRDDLLLDGLSPTMPYRFTVAF